MWGVQHRLTLLQTQRPVCDMKEGISLLQQQWHPPQRQHLAFAPPPLVLGVRQKEHLYLWGVPHWLTLLQTQRMKEEISPRQQQ